MLTLGGVLTECGDVDVMSVCLWKSSNRVKMVDYCFRSLFDLFIFFFYAPVAFRFSCRNVRCTCVSHTYWTLYRLYGTNVNSNIVRHIGIGTRERASTIFLYTFKFFRHFIFSFERPQSVQCAARAQTIDCDPPQESSKQMVLSCLANDGERQERARGVVAPSTKMQKQRQTNTCWVRRYKLFDDAVSSTVNAKM